MNALLSEHLRATFFAEYQALREQLLNILTDDDLARSLGGTTLTIGALCREIGEVEQSYVDSFRTFSQTFEYRHPDAAVEQSVAVLRVWWAALDRDLEAALDAISDEDVTSGRRITRSGQFALTIPAQADVYREALLIFYAKVSVYLRAQGRSLPGDWDDWIA
jgi:uncharacterized damage-inducible protein DinB